MPIITISFEANEPLADIRVDVTGPETATLHEGHFVETATGDSYRYEGTITVTTDGEYTSTLTTAEDAFGNDAMPNTSKTVVIESGPTIPESAIHRWPMDEGSGTVVADSIGSADGSRQGASWISADSWVGGAALSGDGVDDRVETTTLGSFGSRMDGDFSILYTIESDDTASNAAVMGSRASGGQHGLTVGFNNNYWGVQQGVLVGLRTIAGNDDAVVTTDDEIISGRSRVVINKITNTPSNWEVWVDGTLMGTTVERTATLSPAENLHNPLTLFDTYGSNNDLEATLDNIIVCDDSLSNAEIQADYDGQPWT